MKEAPAEDAKAYMSSRQIPQLFESLMTGLMFHRPEDHLEFLIHCIQKAKDTGNAGINWNSFVEPKKSSSALPPISRASKPETSSDESDNTPAPPRSTSKELSSTSPLPPIGSSRETTRSSLSKNVKIPAKVPIVLIMGPPGGGKSTQCEKLVNHYEKYNWVHLSVGDIIRQKLIKEGSAEEKWKVIADLVKRGDMAPDDVTNSLLIEVIQSHSDAGGFLIQGYPRTMYQADEFNRIFRRYDLVIVLDYEEDVCYQRLMERKEKSNRIDDNEAAIKRRLEFFNTETNPVINHFDKEEKTIHLPREGHTGDVFDDIVAIIDVSFFGKEPGTVNISPSSAAPTSRPISTTSRSQSNVSTFVMSTQDEGRKPGLPQAPIFFIMGGPGCGKGAQCQRLLTKDMDAVHLSMGDILRKEITANGQPKEKMDMVCELIYSGEMAPQDMIIDLLLNEINKYKTTSAYLIEGFPRTKWQLEEFNRQVGGLCMAILLDCEVETLKSNVEARQEASGRQDDKPGPLGRRIEFYKSNTLRVAKYLHEHGKLREISTDGKSIDEVQSELHKVYAECIASHQAMKDNGDEVGEPGVVEDAVVAEGAHTTGEVATSSVRSREPSSLSKEVTELSAGDTNVSKEQTDVGKEQTDVSKEQTDVSKAQTDVSKEQTDVSKEQTNVSKESTESSSSSNGEDMAELKGKKVVFVVGGPGCGKGTQCAKIVEKYGFCHLSSGDLLREEVQSGSERGKELNAIMESGALVSLDVVLTLLKEAMLKNKSANGFLIDGYPRELEQGVRFESEIMAPACVLYFEVPDDVMVERLLNRAKTSGRVDDNEETIKKRLKTFHDHCDKVLEHYEKKSLLCKIDARGNVDDIFGEVVKKLDSTN